MADLEAQIKSLMETVDRLEDDVLKCQEEIVILKRTKRETDRKLDETVKEMTVLKTSIEVSDLQEMTSLKRDVQAIQADVDDIKKDVRRIEGSIDPKEAQRLCTEIGGVDRKVNKLTKQVNKESERLYITNEKVERLQRVFNRVHVSCQSGHDLGKEIQGVKQDLSHLRSSVKQQQQQQLQHSPQQKVSPTPQSSAQMLPMKQASATTHSTKQQQQQQQQAVDPKFLTRKTREATVLQRVLYPFMSSETKLRQDIKIRSKFDAYDCSTTSLQTGHAATVKEYRKAFPDSPYINRKTGVYKTPIRGKYWFGGGMTQMKNGRMYFYLHEDVKGRRELLGMTNGACDICGRWDVSWECEEGVRVWLEVVRVMGDAEVTSCGFQGELLE